MGYRGMSAAQPPVEFAQQHFGRLELGDLRLTRRAALIAEKMAAQPHASIPKQCDTTHEAKGAYRFFDHPAVNTQSVTEQHRRNTLRSARDHKVVLLVQDTTELNFGPTKSREGLGPIGYGRNGAGLHMHSTLALTPGAQGIVLGVAHIMIWARTLAPARESKVARRARSDRESMRWNKAILEVGTPPDGTRWIHVGDREADVWETFCAAFDAESDCLIRACGAAALRKTVIGHVDELPPRDEAQGLATLVRDLPASGACEIERHARAGVPKRTIQLNISFAPITMLGPRVFGPDEPGLCVWVVRAWEEQTSVRKDKPVEWVIVTTVPVYDVKDALKVVDWYKQRWTIEEYHKCLKTGCRVEERQLQQGQRLEPLAAMLAIVALRLLNLKKIAKLHPKTPATEAVPCAYVRMLSKLKGIPESELTCDRFWRETAKLGGFLGRRSDGDPGWKTLWLGWRDLELLVQGAKLGTGPPRYG